MLYKYDFVYFGGGRRVVSVPGGYYWYVSNDVRDMKLRKYQELIVEHLLSTPRGNAFVPMGLGKTVSTLKALEALSVLDDSPTLVIAPTRVAHSTWPNEIVKWGLDFSVEVIQGNAQQRERCLTRNANLYTINYENIPWLVDWFKYNKKMWPFKKVIADEVTKLKGFRTRQGTVRARALAEIAHTSIDFWVGLTGTPTPNGLRDLWGPMWFVDKGQRLGKSFTAFSERWFKKTFNGFGLEVLPHSQSEIQNLISDVCLSLDAKDYFDVKDPIRTNIVVELPKKAVQLYKQMEKNLFIALEGKLGPTEVEALNAASKTQKCLQITSGSIYTSPQGDWEEIHDAKIQALEEIIEEANSAPVLVAYHFKHDLLRLKRSFPQGRVLDQDPNTIKDWNQGKIPILFIHPASAGHGLNLQDGGNILVFFTLNWNLEEHQQVIERIGPVRQLQSGHERPVFIYYILAADTIDFDVLERLETKASVQHILMKAMNKHTLNRTY